MISINNTDFTECVQESAYKIDQKNITHTWTDANKRDHEKVIRTKVSGSFDLVFVDGYKKSFNEFLQAVRMAKTDALKITLSINNTNEVKTIYCYYKITAAPPRKITDGRIFRKITVTLEER